MSRDAVTMAEDLGNPYGIVFATFMRSWLCMVRGDAAECAEHAARTLHIAEERGFSFWLPLGRFMQAWASCNRGSRGADDALSERIAAMEKSMQAFTRGGSTNGETTLSLQIAEDCLTAGMLDKGQQWLRCAAETMAETGEVFMRADVTRIKGLLLANRGDLAGAEQKFVEARQVAEQMGSAGLAQRADAAIKALHAGVYGDASQQLPAGKPGKSKKSHAAAAEVEQAEIGK